MYVQCVYYSCVYSVCIIRVCTVCVLFMCVQCVYYSCVYIVCIIIYVYTPCVVTLSQMNVRLVGIASSHWLWKPGGPHIPGKIGTLRSLNQKSGL